MTAAQNELQSLLKSCRMLMRSILTASHDDRDPRAWPIRIRNAERHVHRAVLSLNFNSPSTDEPAESLDRIAASLTTRLVRDLMVEVDRDASREFESRVASSHDREGFHGYTWSIALPDLLGFLHMQQKSGMLRVNIGTELISLIFDDGDLVHASSDNSPPGSRLGEILVEHGAIDMRSLEQFLVRYSASAGRLGDALEQQGLVTRARLRRALDLQVEQIFQRLFASEDSYYSFREGRFEENVAVRRNVLQLLLETCRVRDEAGVERPGLDSTSL